MKVKDFIKKLEELNPEDKIFFELEGDEPGGKTGHYPMWIKQIYRCAEGEVAILFEDEC